MNDPTPSRNRLVALLMELYTTEKALARRWAALATATASAQLRAGWDARLLEAEGHAQRLERAMQVLDASPFLGTTESAPNAESLAPFLEGGSFWDLPAAEQRGREREIAGAALESFRRAETYARELGENRVAELLQQSCAVLQAERMRN